MDLQRLETGSALRQQEAEFLAAARSELDDPGEPRAMPQNFSAMLREQLFVSAPKLRSGR